MRSLRARVTVATIVASALLLALAGGIGVSVYAAGERGELDEMLVRQASEDAQIFSTLEPFQASPLVCCSEEDVATVIWSAKRVNPIFSRGPRPRRIERLGFSEFRAGESRYRTYVMPASFGFGPRFGDLTVQSAVPTDAMDARVAKVRYQVIAAVALGSLLVGIPAWLLAGVALGPLPRIQAGARELAKTADLTRRLPIEGPPEMAEMAESLNRMIDRLQHSVDQSAAALLSTRTFTADAGHELRTPLTSLRANLDVLSRDDLSAEDRERALEGALAAHARVTALIDALQVLARGDAAVGQRDAPVDLAELADAAVVDARRRHPGTSFVLEASDAARVVGDPDGLRMLLDNLLENAALHGGDHVRVHVAERDGYALLAVDDDGPGIPDADKARVFDRFARGRDARNGTGSGLGLAIAAQQAELHGSRLRLSDSPLGGARFELTLSR